jgi:hypothetical protein
MVGGLALDILTRVINVHWADEGLAVEFGDKDRGPFDPAPPPLPSPSSDRVPK